MERGWQISSAARISFQFDLPQPPIAVLGWSISSPAYPATPTCTSRMTTFPRRRLAKCELRSKRRPTIRLSAGTGCAPSPKAQLGSRPCLWNPHCSNDGEKMKTEKNPCARSVRQIRSQALTWDQLAGIETYTDGYLEDILQQAKNKHNSERTL